MAILTLKYKLLNYLVAIALVSSLSTALAQEETSSSVDPAVTNYIDFKVINSKDFDEEHKRISAEQPRNKPAVQQRRQSKVGDLLLNNEHKLLHVVMNEEPFLESNKTLQNARPDPIYC